MPTEKEIKDRYNQRHADEGKKAWRPYEAYFVKLDCLKVEKGKRLLDVGCGTGYLLKAAEDTELETYGIDISGEAVKISRKISPSSKITEGSGKNQFPRQFF